MWSPESEINSIAMVTTMRHSQSSSSGEFTDRTQQKKKKNKNQQQQHEKEEQQQQQKKAAANQNAKHKLQNSMWMRFPSSCLLVFV